MDWEEIVAQEMPTYVTNRYKVTKQQDEKLREIEMELNIPPSAIIRLALNTFLPKIKDSGFKYSGIKDVYNNSRF